MRHTPTPSEHECRSGPPPTTHWAHRRQTAAAPDRPAAVSRHRRCVRFFDLHPWYPLESIGFHQSLHRASGHRHTLLFHARVHLAGSVHPDVVGMSLPDLGQNLAVAHRTCRFRFVAGSGELGPWTVRSGRPSRAKPRRSDRPRVRRDEKRRIPRSALWAVDLLRGESRIMWVIDVKCPCRRVAG
ncbi:hypothetical protein ABH939_006664 [Rhodococcus sp. 27YEA6]